MHRILSVALALATALTIATRANGADRVILFPFGNSNVLTTLDAATLAETGTIEAPASAFKVQQSLNGGKYYIVTQRSQSSVVVVDAASLRTTKALNLPAGPSDAVLTPDGKYLLVAAANIQVIDTTTDELLTTIQVAGAPTQILVDDTSRRAYALTSNGNQIAVIDLATLSVITSVSAPNSGSIALTTNNARLLAVTTSGVRQFRTRDFAPADTIPGQFNLVNATITALPNSSKVIVQSRGIAPNNTAQLIDLSTGQAQSIGAIGTNELTKVAVLNAQRAYAIDATTMALQVVDFTATPNPTVTPLPFGQNTRDIAISPNGKHLYASSLTNARLLKINTETNELEGSILTPIAPAGHALAFGPSKLPPVAIAVNGGDQQYFPPDTLLPTPFSVRVTDANGSPVAGVPVFFEDPAAIGLQIEPTQPSVTNQRGIATAIVTVPPQDRLTGGAFDEELALDNAGNPIDSIEPVTISATTPGIDPALFTLNVIRAAGLIKISGNYQVGRENEPFPLPYVFLATDREGQPLPSGTEVVFGWFFASCSSFALPVDPDGFVTVRCTGNRFSPLSQQLYADGVLTATIPTYQQELGISLTTESFAFSVARGGSRIQLTKLSGDGQSATTGSPLREPLTFRMASDTQGRPDNPITVEIDQISGPPVILEKRRTAVQLRATGTVGVTLGPNAGTAVIRMRSSTPGLPEIFYTIEATGGQPSQLVKSGDGQVGKISNPLPSPLRVVVINESGSPVPFPEVTWRVVSGDASIASTNDAGGSNASVTFGQTPGSVRIVAAIGSLQANFTVTSLPPEPASISTVSGQNQTITTGVLSDPLTVRVNEIDNAPAAGAIVTFSGPPSVRLHPTSGNPPGNPVQMATNIQGLAGVRVELINLPGLSEEGAKPAQLAQTVSITASIGGQLATSFLLNVVGRTPALTQEGVVNAATGERGIVPGSLLTIYGTGLMEGVIGVQSVGGQTSFKGTQVRIGGIPAPLLAFASGPPEQINLQAPFELSPGQTTTIEVENNGSRATISNVPVFLAQPGIFEIQLQQGGRVGAVIHADGSLVTPDNAAAHGEALALFATGVGRLNSGGVTGAPGPIPPALASLPTIVGVDNKGAPVLFSGYAPGFLGLYQVNFTVPIDSRCGSRPLNLRIGDASSPQTTLPVRCPQ